MRQKRTNKRKRKTSWLPGFLIIFFLAATVILSLPIWKLSKVQIFGVNLISKTKVTRVAQVPFGDNIFFINVKSIRKRLMRIVQVKDVAIKRRLPDTLSVNVTEREPFALLALDSKTVLIDEDGYIIATQGEASYFKVPDVSRLPIIRGIKPNSLVAGKRLNYRDKIFVARILKLLSKYISPESLQIDTSNLGNIIVFVDDILRLELGDTEKIESKIGVFGSILKEIDGKWEKIDYISVKIPDFPVVKFKP